MSIGAPPLSLPAAHPRPAPWPGRTARSASASRRTAAPGG